MKAICRTLPVIGLLCASAFAHADGAFNQTDKRFVTDAANAGVYEVQAAQVAVRQARSPEVKAYAQMLLDDHKKANAALEQLAASRSMDLPRELPHEQRGRVQALERENPEKFDRQFVQRVGIDDHEKDIELFENVVAKATDTELKSLARKTLPTLKEHRQHALALIGKLK